MKRYVVAALALAAVLAIGCTSVVTKNFKVFTEPADANIRVVSGLDLKELKFTPPATITAEVPTDPKLAAKAFVEVRSDNYKTKTIALKDINDGAILNVKLEKIAQRVKYRLKYRLVSPEVSQELAYRDKIISVSLTVTDQSFQMRFENVSSSEVKILWDRTQYADVNQKTHPLMHSGIRYSERNNPLPDQVVPAHTVVQEAVTPISSVYVSPQTKTYDIRPLFPLESDAAAGLKGKSIILFLPVEVERQIVPYNFKIEIIEAVKELIKE